MERSRWKFAVVLAAFSIPTMAASQATCSRMAVSKLDQGLYNFQMNENDSALKECATMNGVGFTITAANFANATNGQAAAYSSIYRGCHWGACTVSNPFPIEENHLASATASVNLTQPPGGNNDAAYDIWFNQTSETRGQPNGAEVMIWLNHQGVIQPFGTRVATVTINGAQYEVWTGNQSSWKIVSYVASKPVTTSRRLNLLPFFADAVSRGSLRPSWWIIDVEFGFEIWTGGQGLAISDFSVDAAARSGSIGNPPAPSTIAATRTNCHVGYSILNQWPGGFQAGLTLENTGSAALTSWTLTWTFANGQTIANLWNGSPTQNGANVTVTDMSYNRSIPPGSSYSGMGFTGTWNNVNNATPASFAINGTICH